MNRRSFFGLLGATFVAPFLPRKAEASHNHHITVPEQVQWMQMAPEKWPGQDSGNLWISPYQNLWINRWNTGTHVR